MKPRRSGWVYVLTNSAMPGLVKIGCTGRSPEVRAAELSAATGVPAPFAVAWAWPVTDWRAVEQVTHGKLGACRPDTRREFFRCSVPHARRAIARAARAWLRPAWLRLLIGPRRPAPPGPPSRGRPRSGDLVPALAGGAMLVAVLAVGLGQPVPPSWLPDGPTRAILAVERLIVPPPVLWPLR